MSDKVCINGYCHKTPGRLRVRVTNLRKRNKTAKSLELLLGSQPGISHVRANHVTGNVLIKFDIKLTSHEAVFQSLEDLGHLPMISELNSDYDQGMEAISEIGMNIGKNLAKVMLKEALRGSAAAIILELL